MKGWIWFLLGWFAASPFAFLFGAWWHDVWTVRQVKKHMADLWSEDGGR